MVWSSSPVLTFLLLLISLASGFLPAASVYISANVIGAATRAIFSHGQELNDLWDQAKIAEKAAQIEDNFSANVPSASATAPDKVGRAQLLENKRESQFPPTLPTLTLPFSGFGNDTDSALSSAFPDEADGWRSEDARTLNEILDRERF